jgi:hypothetical protein
MPGIKLFYQIQQFFVCSKRLPPPTLNHSVRIIHNIDGVACGAVFLNCAGARHTAYDPSFKFSGGEWFAAGAEAHAVLLMVLLVILGNFAYLRLRKQDAIPALPVKHTPVFFRNPSASDPIGSVACA